MAEPLDSNLETGFPHLGGPERAASRSNLALNTAAENLGNAVGTAVDRVKRLPDRVQEMKQRFTVIRGRTQQNLASSAGDLKDQAQRRVAQVRTRARLLARREPLQVIMAAAVLGCVLGVVLRIWRDHAD